MTIANVNKAVEQRVDQRHTHGQGDGKSIHSFGGASSSAHGHNDIAALDRPTKHEGHRNDHRAFGNATDAAMVPRSAGGPLHMHKDSVV